MNQAVTREPLHEERRAAGVRNPRRERRLSVHTLTRQRLPRTTCRIVDLSLKPRVQECPEIRIKGLLGGKKDQNIMFVALFI